MALYRLEIKTQRPYRFEVINRESADEAGAVAWACKKYRVKADKISAMLVDPGDGAAIADLSKRLKSPLGGYSVTWEHGRVVSLDLGGPLCTFGGITDKQIEPIQHLTSLRALWLRGELKITDNGLRVLRPLRGLIELILDEMQIGDDCVPYIQHLTSLETLYLGKATLLDQNIKRRATFTDRGLRRLRKMTRLFALSLDYNDVTGSGFEAFEGFDALEHLSCSYTPFNDRGMANIARMLKLKKLSLDRTDITDRGLAHVARLTMLQDLYISDTKVSDAGLPYLTRLSDLRFLNLQGTLVTRKAAKKLAKRLRRCSIGLPGD